jgi:flagellar motor switch protein FliG
MYRRPNPEMNGRRKAAIILTVLGPSVAGSLLKSMNEEQAEKLSLEVARLEKITPQIRAQVVKEFHEMCRAQDYIAEGGLEKARKVLEAAYGPEVAQQILARITNAMQVVPFEFLRKADPLQLLSFIRDEHPQTIALILAYMPTQGAAEILSRLPAELRGEVAERIASMDQTNPDVNRKVEAVLESKLSSVMNDQMTKAGGPKALVELLQSVDRSTERVILDSLTENNPELADEVKNMMIVFEDIMQLDDRAIQSLMKEVDVKDLGLALKAVGDNVKDKIFRNMSERASNMLKEDMDFMGPVKMKAVEEAQQRIVSAIRRLEETGEITIGRGDDADVFV